ncbi:zf-CCHC domain-containing protein, partial [Cephalotus follicularis]
ESSKKEEVICYECNKPRHYKSDCPTLKKNKEHSKKKKAMMATWSDSDDSSSDEESDGEVTNIAFMAIENEEENEVHLSTSLFFDELKDAYDELVEYSENLSLKHSSLKKLNNSLTCKIEELKTNVLELEKDKERANSLEKENESLKLEIDALKNTFSKFSNSSDKLDKLLGIQRCVFDKAGLGCNEMNNVKHFNNFFVKRNEPKITYNYCGKQGHISISCLHKKKIGFVKTRKNWVPKGTKVTDMQGPKTTWVPKG